MTASGNWAGVWLPAAPSPRGHGHGEAKRKLPRGRGRPPPGHAAVLGSGRHRHRALLLCALEAAATQAPSHGSVRTGQLCLAAVGPDPAAPTRAQRPPELVPGHRPAQAPSTLRRAQTPSTAAPGRQAWAAWGRAARPRRQRGCREAAVKAVPALCTVGKRKDARGQASPRSLLPRVPHGPSRLGSCHRS